MFVAQKVEDQIKMTQLPRTAKNLGATVGMLANGCAGSWEISIDESLSGSEKWFMQIEGVSIYLYVQIDHPRVVDELIGFLKQGKSLPESSPMPQGEVKVGHFGRTPVILVWDCETSLRFAILISGKKESTLRISLEGQDVIDFSEALEQVRNDLS